MSKERLEEIKDMVNAFDESLFVSLYGYELYSPSIISDFKYLIKRVQELEEKYEKSKSMFTDAYGKQIKLEKQNKRYREAIKRALERLNGTVAERCEIAVIYTDLAKALEASE